MMLIDRGVVLYYFSNVKLLVMQIKILSERTMLYYTANMANLVLPPNLLNKKKKTKNVLKIGIRVDRK